MKNNCFIRIVKEKSILISILFLALLLMDFNQTMSSGWIGPYLSAAANFDFSSMDMMVNLNDLKYFNTLSKDKQFEYHFPSNSETIKYNHLAIGYMFILLLSKSIFFFLSDLESIQYLQYFVHIFTVLSILNLLDQRYKKVLFFLFYGINPIILYFVNYTFYYFWQFVPAVVFLYYYLSNKKAENIIFLLAILFFLLYMVRPTILFFVIFFFLYIARKEGWKKPIASMALFFILIGMVPSHGYGPWHTMYVGLGAYDNKYDIKLSDESGYKYFHDISGRVFNSSLATDSELKKDYYDALKNRYLEIVKEEPLLVVRNGILNILGAYSVGYKTGNTMLIYLNILFGTVMIGLLLYSKQYILFLAIGTASISFTPYYPPISAYMYGSYILIVVGFIGVVNFNKLNSNKEDG